MAVAYRRSWLLGQRHAVNLSLRVLSGWDFTVQDAAAAALMHGLIRNHLKVGARTHRHTHTQHAHTHRHAHTHTGTHAHTHTHTHTHTHIDHFGTYRG